MTCFRDTLRGINAFATAKASWRTQFFTLVDDYVSFIDMERPDGLLLGALRDYDEAKQAVERVANCVGVCGWHAAFGVEGVAEFEVDDERVGEVAGHHLLQKGYRHFAFVGDPTIWADKRAAGYVRTIQQAGYSCSVLEQEEESSFVRRGWYNSKQSDAFSAWLRGLPRPLALMASNDVRARGIVQVCRNQGIRVPDDIAVIGVDNDDLDCELADPPLSSVAIPWRQIGYDAAQLLDRMMEGEQPGPPLTLVPPVGVVERQSTDTIAISDQDVIAAIRFIRNHSHEQIGVEDILREVPVGRRSLEKRFRKILDRSPLEEIRRVHVERAKHLLTSTDLPIGEVARSSGFGGASWFSEAFGEIVGESPAGYRKRYQRL